MVTKTRSPKRSSSTITLGRQGFAKISAIEGISLSPQAEEDFREFDRQGLSAAERRQALLRKYGLKL